MVDAIGAQSFQPDLVADRSAEFDIIFVGTLEEPIRDEQQGIRRAATTVPVQGFTRFRNRHVAKVRAAFRLAL
jgi:hypothetical protein